MTNKTAGQKGVNGAAHFERSKGAAAMGDSHGAAPFATPNEAALFEGARGAASIGGSHEAARLKELNASFGPNGSNETACFNGLNTTARTKGPNKTTRPKGSNKTTRPKGSRLIATGLLLIAAALFLAGYNVYEAYKAAELSESVLNELSDLMRSGVAEGLAGSGRDIPDYVLNPNMDMPTKEVNGQEYIGVLRIDSLGLELPVMSAWSYPKLKVAPCRYSGSAYLDNLVIAAHNYTKHFGKLKNLTGGELVTFTDADGNVFTYEVALVETLQPTAVDEMQSSTWDLSLFTCTLGGSSRVTVRCEQIQSPWLE